MSRDNLGSKQTFVLHNCLIKNDRHDLVITLHRQTNKILCKKNTKKDNCHKTKANYQKTIFKTTQRSFRLRNKHNTGTSRLKRYIKYE